MKHTKNCNWIKSNCSWMLTHEYCPHEEHKCDCMTKTDTWEKIRDIVSMQFGHNIDCDWLVKTHGKCDCIKSENIKIILNECRSLLASLLVQIEKEVIGEDEIVQKTDDFYDADVGMERAEAKNSLRKQQRAALKRMKI